MAVGFPLAVGSGSDRLPDPGEPAGPFAGRGQHFPPYLRQGDLRQRHVPRDSRRQTGDAACIGRQLYLCGECGPLHLRQDHAARHAELRAAPGQYHHHSHGVCDAGNIQGRRSRYGQERPGEKAGQLDHQRQLRCPERIPRLCHRYGTGPGRHQGSRHPVCILHRPADHRISHEVDPEAL